jgi:hypothetical protein
MYKSYIHTTNFYGKKAIKQANTQIKYIYYKNIQKKIINILKLSSNKKWTLLLA